MRHNTPKTESGHLQPITVGRYADPERVGGWQGYVEPADRRWILFLGADGAPMLFAHRDRNGGCVGPACPVPELTAEEQAEMLDGANRTVDR